jgi:2-deoxy-D-gluconate 3-dehydrogenase
MILEKFKLDGKVAIVTGAGRGIGQAYALGLAEAGADVAIVDVIDMTETVDKFKALGRKAIAIKADLAKGEKESPKIIAKVVKALGRVDILVNNAGIIRREPFVEHSAKNWNDVISINLSTPFFLSQAAAKQMIEQGEGGKIINIGSMLSFQGGILIPGYSAAKGGIKSLTMLMANELSKVLGGADFKERISHVVACSKLPMSVANQEISVDDFVNAMAGDKKNSNGQLRFVVLENIGDAKTVVVDKAIVEKVVEDCLK